VLATASAASREPQLAALATQASDTSASRHAINPAGSGAWERDQLLDRLGSLRRVLPALAQEMVAARRQAARLRTDNRRLAEQVRQLRATLEAREHR
jgi:hypothetical protein